MTAAVHTREAGDPDSPLLLCLHGIGSSSAAFAPQLAGLADRVHVVAWDAPGYADSADPDRAPGLDGYVDTAADLIREHGGPAHVLGVSWGGVIALRLAARHPDLVASLIVADSSRGSGTDPDRAKAMRGRAAALAAQGPGAFAAARGPRLVSAAAPPALVERVVATMAGSVRSPGYGYAAASMAEADLTGELPAIAAPALVLCGEQDTVTGPDESQAIAGALPTSVYVTLSGAGHLANQERPEAFNAWVRAHLHVVARVPA
ncbi:pimeloyl-ACP methyl ester carboxylesterase [Streptomyces sp. 840.1]|uniref:alpha/beta fold hydrolase n=1 Tax=Streptomyces sp. 840.1 TaxID=2485152 RepID=UPI000F498A5D|nr:alpha/beta hydrolase [Streptomyces sp. 840.1]ROQ69705.1 pimeloyl-ACP methyl ester carboxylesterase [Streptomyces sp. 840.1]